MKQSTLMKKVAETIRGTRKLRVTKVALVDDPKAEYPPHVEVTPLNRQRLDHYGNGGDGWEDEAWEINYAAPLREQVVDVLVAAGFDSNTFWVEIGEKGHITIWPR